MNSTLKVSGSLSRCIGKAFSRHLTPRISRRICTPALPQGTQTPNVKELAKMAQVSVTDKEASEWQPKINSIIDWFGLLQKVDTSGVVPAIHTSEHGTPLRTDDSKLHEARDDILAMAPSLEKSYIRVPKISTGADAEEVTAVKSEDVPASLASATVVPVESSQTAEGVESFQSLDIRVGKVVSCEKHPEADSLYVEKIDVGEPEPRTIVSGLVKFVPIEQMQDRMVVVICNLKARNMRGIKSFGMVLAASNPEHTQVEPLCPPTGAKPGDRIFSGKSSEQAAPATANVVEKKKHWDNVQTGLKTNSDGVAMWKGLPLQVSAGPIRSETLKEASIA